MSFTKVIKAPNAQQCIGSFVACCQQSYYQPQNPPGSHQNDFDVSNFDKKNKLNLKKSFFCQNYISSTFIYKFLLQNISSLNSLSNKQKHDYSQFQGDEFIHALKIEQDQMTSGISETQTIQSEFISSIKTSVETFSDSESVFDNDFQNLLTTEN